MNKIFKENGATLRKFVAVTVYAIAMGYLESAVVIYLRQTAYGNLSQVFPVRFLEPQLGRIEFIREAATIIMLLAIGYVSGINKSQRWMFFIYSFAVWDIFYYMFLKLFTGWPNSFGDFDVLFLIPVIWVSPVICPILTSILLTLTSTILIFIGGKSGNLRIGINNLAIFLLGSTIDFYSFTEPIFRILFRQGPKGLGNFTPASFDWPMFFIGYLLLCISAIKTITNCYHKMISESVRSKIER